MAYSNRRWQRPDPTVAPVEYDSVTGRMSTRRPFTPSAYLEQKRLKAATARKECRMRGIVKSVP